MPYMNTDVPELGGFDTGLVLENLELIFGRQEPWLEATVVQLSELADAILRDAGNDPDTLYSILLSLQGYASEEMGATRNPDSPYVRGMEQSLGIYQHLLLYHFLCLKRGDLPPLSGHTQRELLPSSKGRIAYMKSAPAAKAYIRFAQGLLHCREVAFHSFVDACEEVAGGLCEYCILPLRTSTEGQLMSFYRLIIKYRLQIVATCDVEHRVGGHTVITTFGLLRSMGESWDIADLLDNPFLPADRSTPLSLAMLYIPQDNGGAGDVLTAAACCAIPLRETGTLPGGEILPLLYSGRGDAEDAVARGVFYFSFDVTVSPPSQRTPSMPQAFLMHLTVESSDHVILGLYPRL